MSEIKEAAGKLTGEHFLQSFVEAGEIPPFSDVQRVVILAAMAAFAQYRVAHCPDTGKGAMSAAQFYQTSANAPRLGISGGGPGDSTAAALDRVFAFAEAYAAQSSPTDTRQGMSAEKWLVNKRLVRVVGQDVWDSTTDKEEYTLAELLEAYAAQSGSTPDILGIPYSESFCGHSSQYCWTADGGKHIVCLLCEHLTAAENSSPEDRKTERITAEARYRKELPDTTNREASIYRDGFHDGWDANAAHSSRKLPVPPQPNEFSRESPIAEPKATQLIEAIKWALGESGEFAARQAFQGAYWWRTELRKRAFGPLPPSDELAQHRCNGDVRNCIAGDHSQCEDLPPHPVPATPEISQQEAQRLADDFGVPVSFDEEISPERCCNLPESDLVHHPEEVERARSAAESIPSVAPAKEKI